MTEEYSDLTPEEVALRQDQINRLTDNPFYSPKADSYVSEKEAKIYLTREDIRELGFLRTDPRRMIYRHKDKPNLLLQELFQKDYSVKDLVVRRILVFTNNEAIVKYDSTTPNKQDIRQIIDNYAN